MIYVKIPGPPVAQGRGKAARWKAKDGREGVTVRDPAKAKTWKATAQSLMMQAMNGRPPYPGPVSLSIVAVFPCPLSDYRKSKPRERRWCMKASGDADNVAAATMNAGNAVLWLDDRQVVALTVRKYIGAQGEPPCVELWAGEMEALE